MKSIWRPQNGYFISRHKVVRGIKCCPCPLYVRTPECTSRWLNLCVYVSCRHSTAARDLTCLCAFMTTAGCTTFSWPWPLTSTYVTLLKILRLGQLWVKYCSYGHSTSHVYAPSWLQQVAWHFRRLDLCDLKFLRLWSNIWCGASVSTFLVFLSTWQP